MQILTLSSIRSRLHKLLHKKTTSQNFATSRETYPFNFLLSAGKTQLARFLVIWNIHYFLFSTNLYFNFELFVPLLGLTWNIHFCPKSKFWTYSESIRTASEFFQNTVIQSNLWFISPNGLSNETARRRYLISWNREFSFDKAIEVRSEIIHTRLGC